jgi:hypothetical protein
MARGAPTPGTIQSSERGRELARRRHSLDTYIKSIVARAPELTAEQIDELASILRGATIARGRA